MAGLRRKWNIHPATRIKSSDKNYDRSRMKEETQKEVSEYYEGSSGTDTLPCPDCSSRETICYAKLYDKPGRDQEYYRCNSCLYIFINFVKNQL